MSPKEAAKILGCSPNNVRVMIRNGVMKAKTQKLYQDKHGKMMFQYLISETEVARVKALDIKPRGVPRGPKTRVKLRKYRKRKGKSEK